MPHFSLRQTPALKLEFVISISKKVAKKAVARNLLKRRIRPILRTFSAKLPKARYLLVARPGAPELKGEELKAELKALFKLQ